MNLIIFLIMDNKHPLSKKEQGMILEKIKSGIWVSHITNRDGEILTYPHHLRFIWYPFIIRYEFIGLGWIPVWSPLARELARIYKESKRNKRLSNLKRYGLE
jgi:hypothetical protein